MKKQDAVLPLKTLKALRGGRLSLFWNDWSAQIVRPMTHYPDPPAQGEESESDGKRPPPISAALAIDFGTSTIAVAVAGTNTEVLRFRRPDTGALDPLLDAPMGRRSDLGRATLADNYTLNAVAGLDTRDWSYYPCLKRRIELLARASTDREWMAEAALDVAGVCLRALSIAEDKRGTPLEKLLTSGSRVYVSVPNTFPEAGVEVIRTGVGYAVAAILRTDQVPKVETLLEAEAVAYGELLHPQLSGSAVTQDPILVIDAGAGTTDASILRRVDSTLQVVAHAGLPVGGIDLDAFIASLDGPLSDLVPEVLSQRLRAAEALKKKHWQQRDDDADISEEHIREAMDALSHELTDPNTPGRDAVVARRSTALGEAHRRYRALASHALIRSLPRQELTTVKSVILSGRSSLVLGFRTAVQEALADLGCGSLKPTSQVDVDRKLAVVRGVSAFHEAGGSSMDRRPLRATFPVVLTRALRNDELLMKEGHPLVAGWGVVAWHQAGDDAEGEVTYTIRSRLVGDEVIKELLKRKHLLPPSEGEEANDVLKWSRMFLTVFSWTPPFSARLAYDFLSRKVDLEVDGMPVTLPSLPVDDSASTLFGRFHPIHQMQENWFETHHARRG